MCPYVWEPCYIIQKKSGFGISSFKEISEKLKLKKRFGLKNSNLQNFWLRDFAVPLGPFVFNC